MTRLVPVTHVFAKHSVQRTRAIARGDAHEDSDYDVVVFLCEMADRWQEFGRLADLSTDILAAQLPLSRLQP